MKKKAIDGQVQPVVMLPCPFCGFTPRLKYGKVKCVNIMCKVQPKIRAWYAPGYDKEAIEEWNSREKDGCKPSAPVSCSANNFESVLNRTLELIWISGIYTISDVRHQLIEEFGDETISLMRTKYGL